MTETQSLLVRIDKFLQQVINGQIARCTGEHTFASANALSNQFYDSGGLSRSGRTVDDGNILGR